jgi:gamma-glutamyl:cysteine ligase YbdK (ATP-grasp superfamily)
MKRSFGLFERFGVELEYMLVDADTLAVRPESDLLIKEVSGSLEGDVSRGPLEWSNELSLHLIELKTGKPAPKLKGLSEVFQSEVRFINRLLAKSGSRLMPTAMHPWMHPGRESRLWPHSCGDIYAAFDRIFNCSGHGWTNLQSTHLNLPFKSAAQFRRLHTAIRLLLPILPALAASSPFIDGRRAPVLDMRLETYRHNCRRVPFVTGRVIPEPIASPAEYRRRILQRLYRELAMHDPDEILREEWANARGAIARFERNTIEIRVLDIQECPAADLAIVEFIVAVLRALVNEEFSIVEEQLAPSTVALEKLMLETIAVGGRALVRSSSIRSAFGLTAKGSTTVHELCCQFLDLVAGQNSRWRNIILQILDEGSLAERILRAAGKRPNRRALRTAYGQLADCLDQGRMFSP